MMEGILLMINGHLSKGLGQTSKEYFKTRKQNGLYRKKLKNRNKSVK